ncbi:trans-sialidase [Trypanosoma cruzi]|nr:trans-sialidase [Trypanosoma cruzi]
MAAPISRSLGSAVLRYCWACVCALPRQPVETLVRHTFRVAFAAIPTAVRTVCARVPPGDWNMNWPFTPCAPDSAIRECLPCLAPDPGGVLSAFLRRLVPAARCSY